MWWSLSRRYVIAVVVLIPFCGCAGCTGYSTAEMHGRGRLLSSLPVPQCTSTPPAPIAQDQGLFQNACWVAGDSRDRIESASCRIAETGTLSCGRDRLKPVPSGAFVVLDEAMSVACAIRESGTAVCWSGKSGVWTGTPDTSFAQVSASGDWSPIRQSEGYACGLTPGGVVQCWEPAGYVVTLPGKYKQVEVGGGYARGKVCTLSVEGALSCWSSVGTPPKKAFEVVGSFEVVALGPDTGCALDPHATAHCWGVRVAPLESPITLHDIKQIRAGMEHACGLHSNGEVVCVGNARTPPALAFARISEPSLRGNYCGLSVDGTGYCWGTVTQP